MNSLALIILLPGIVAFVVGIAITPLITKQLYKRKMWKKKAGKGAGYGGGGTPLFDELHKHKDTNTPRMGGLVVWISVLITTGLFMLFDTQSGDSLGTLNFLSREQTWLPLIALVVGAGVGFLDDWFTVRGGGSYFADGLHLRERILAVAGTGLFIGWWFYAKLEVSSVSLLAWGPVELGWGFVPFFVFVAVCVYMSSVIDGVDGLSGGVFATIFAAYAGVALQLGQFDIAALCSVIVGSVLAFLWFNIPPARFYMTETGLVALTMSLTVIAFMTDTLVDGVGLSVLPIIGFLLVVTVAANTIQILSKKYLGRKVFLVAPIHHHFEALGWPAYKVTMRYWIIGIVAAVIGVVVAVSV